MGALTSCTMEGIADLWRAKATVASVQEQQDTFAEFSRALNPRLCAGLFFLLPVLQFFSLPEGLPFF